MQNKLLPFIEVAPKAPASASVIWLHGLGASGHDFAPAVQHHPLFKALPIRFIFPHAPSRPVTINGGYVMPAWYDVLGLSANSREDETGIAATEVEIKKLIEHEVERGIAPQNIVLAGFSQGGAMALYTGLHYSQRLAGILALSSYLPLAKHSINSTLSCSLDKNTPIFLAHGQFDDIVPMTWGKHCQEYLSELGYHVEWHHYPMAHHVCDQELADIAIWLQQQLNKNKED